MNAAVAGTATQVSDYFALDTLESLRLASGMTVMLNRIEPGRERHFHHVEDDDVFGIGFHLRGGAAFEMGAARVFTQPFDVWAGTGPRGAVSSFTLPASGFRTVSLRFAPDAAKAFFSKHHLERSRLATLARIAAAEVASVRLDPLDSAAARVVEAMFAAPYSGAARALFFESGALALLASQMNDARLGECEPGWKGRPMDRKRLMKAREVLEASLAQPPSITQLSRLVGLNEFKLKRDFKQMFGTTIFGYVRQRRMERAAVDLHAGLPVAQAAAAVGYQCPRCFAEAFRRHFGTLPSEVSRQVLQKLPRAAD